MTSATLMSVLLRKPGASGACRTPLSAALAERGVRHAPLAPGFLKSTDIKVAEVIAGLEQAVAFRTVIEDSGHVIPRAARGIEAGEVHGNYEFIVAARLPRDRAPL